MQIKQSKQKPYDQLIEQLRSQGLYLTQQKIIKLPMCVSPPPTIITRIISLISNRRKIYDLNSKKKVWPMDQNMVMITLCNTLSVYTLNKDKSECIDVKQKQKFHMQQNIQLLIYSPNQNISQTDTKYFILTYKQSNLISLFSMTGKPVPQINLKHQINCKSQVSTVQFISMTQFLMVTNKYVIYHYKIQKESLKLIRQIGHFQMLNKINPRDSLVFVKLFCRPKEEQDSLTVAFYATFNQDTNKCEINVKEMTRQLDGGISMKQETYRLFQFTSIPQSRQLPKQKLANQGSPQSKSYDRQNLKQVQVIKQKDYFLLKLHHETFIIKKHFEKYVRLDAVTQNFSSFKSLVIEHHVPLICCIGLNRIELWHVSVQSKKSNWTLMDVINLNPADKVKQDQFLKFWVMNYKNKIQTVFAFDRGGRQIGFFAVNKIDKVSKLVERISKGTSKNQILQIQQLGKKLGVNRKSLYLKLWNQNQKNPTNIYLYLLQSYDLPSIHKQLEKYMKKKFISTLQLIKIHNQIQKILLADLQQHLDFKTLKWFLKTNFQKRKLELYSRDTQITFKEFQDIYNSSIFDLINNIIKQKLEKIKSGCNVTSKKEQKDSNIYVYHILQEFKLLILQNYEEFLFKLLNNYKYDIVQVFENFPYLLPKLPFRMQVFTPQTNLNCQVIVSNLKISFNVYQSRHSKQQPQRNSFKQKTQKYLAKSQNKIGTQNKNFKSQTILKQNDRGKYGKQQINVSYLRGWFNEVTEQEWSHQKSSVDFIFNFLYPHYQTHQVMSLISQFTESQWFQKNKYHTHCLINTTLNAFQHRVSKIQGIKLYLSVCQFANKVKFQSQDKLESQDTTKAVLLYVCRQSQTLQNIRIKEQDQIFETSKQNLKRNLISHAPLILQIMKDKGLLNDQGYQICLLYSKMHDLMVSKQIVKRQTTIFQIVNSSHSSLIATFFIGQRQRNAQLFNDLLPLYSNKILFYEALNEYIKSANCSRVQLQILVNELKHRQSQLRQQNNTLAELLISGFCLRTQIRQKHEAHSIIEMFKEVELKLDLVLKLQKFIVVKDQLAYIFEFFMCEKLNFEQVINQPENIIRLIMDNYFNGNLNYQILRQYNLDNFMIEEKVVQLDIIQNTFPVLLYLRQKLYVEQSLMDLSLIYGQIMVQWEQFDALKNNFCQQNNSVCFNSVEYFQRLIALVLNQIYTKQDIYMNEQTVSHIQNILSLLQKQTTNQLIVRQRTKLKLSKLLQNWGYRIQSVTLQLICIKWKEENREQLIIQIMDNCIEYFDLWSLKQLYRLLQTTRSGKQVLQERSPLSIKLAYQLVLRLAVYSNQFREEQVEKTKRKISQVIYFINRDEKKDYTTPLDLMFQTFLSLVLQNYGLSQFSLEKELQRENLMSSKQLVQAKLQSQQGHTRQLTEMQPTRKDSTCFLKAANKMSTPRVNEREQTRGKPGNYNSNKKLGQVQKSNINSSNMYQKGYQKVKQNRYKDPIDGFKFDDPGFQQRIFNRWKTCQQKLTQSYELQKLTQTKSCHSEGRGIIENFVLNWRNTQVINQMFKNNFTKIILPGGQQVPTAQHILVSQTLHLQLDQWSPQSSGTWQVKIQLQQLWQLNLRVNKKYIEHYIIVLKHRFKQFEELLAQKYIKLLFYGYFFLLMSLKYPQTLSFMKGVQYQYMSNLQLVHQLQKLALQKKGSLRIINFEVLWKRFYDGLKTQLIQKLQQLQIQTKIPQNIQMKVLERLINQLGKDKIKINLYFKILSTVEELLAKYVKQQKPKVLNELKFKLSQIFEIKRLDQPKKMQRKSNSNDDMRITLRKFEEVKQEMNKQYSRIRISEAAPGFMKQISDTFQQVKRSKNFPQNSQNLKQILVQTMKNRNAQFAKTQSPFQSSIILQNNLNMHYPPQSPTRNLDLVLLEKAMFLEGKHKSFSNQCFQSQKQGFQSLISNQSQAKIFLHSYSDFLEDIHNSVAVPDRYNLPYHKLVQPEQLTKNLAIKDSKFQKNYHITHPASEQINRKITNFARLLNSYEVNTGRNSKYYVQDSLKKMRDYSNEEIIKIIQQIYFQDESILITLNQKQLQTNKIRRLNGLDCQQQKYKQASISFVLRLVKSLNLDKTTLFDNLLELVQRKQIEMDAIIGSKQQNNEVSVGEVKGIKQKFHRQIKRSFPLSDLTFTQQNQNIQTQVQNLFARAYLNDIAFKDQISFKQFKFITTFYLQLLDSITQDKTQQFQLKWQKYDRNQLKNYFVCLLIWQMIKIKQPSQQLKMKFKFMLQKIQKQFLIQIHQPTKQLLSNNGQLQQLFSIKIIKTLSPN